MPNNKRILHPEPRKKCAKLITAGATDDQIRDALGRPDLDVPWFRDWLTPQVIAQYDLLK